MAQLVAALDCTCLALSHTRVTIGLDGTFTLHIPIGSFVVSAALQANTLTTAAGNGQPQVIASASSGVADVTANNVGPTPDEVRKGLAEQGTDAGGKWYCVTCGLDVGVFKYLNKVTPITLGVPTSAHCKHDTQAAALEAYTRSWSRGNIHRL